MPVNETKLRKPKIGMKISALIRSSRNTIIEILFLINTEYTFFFSFFKLSLLLSILIWTFKQLFLPNPFMFLLMALFIHLRKCARILICSIFYSVFFCLLWFCSAAFSSLLSILSDHVSHVYLPEFSTSSVIHSMTNTHRLFMNALEYSIHEL